MKIQVSTRVRVKMPLHFRTVARKGKLSIEKFCSEQYLKIFLDPARGNSISLNDKAAAQHDFEDEDSSELN